MTRWAIVRDGKRYVVVPEDRIGGRVLNCFYMGHLEGARKLADAMTEETYHLGKFRPTGKKKPPVVPSDD